MVVLLIFLLLIGVSSLLCFYAIRTSRNSTEQLTQSLRELRLQKMRMQVSEIQEGIEIWLMSLGLPQLARQKQRQEAARQLSIVLTERLLGWPSLRQTSREDHKSTLGHEDLQAQSGNKARTLKQGQRLKMPKSVKAVNSYAISSNYIII